MEIGPGIALPRVTIVVINYNYARYLAQTPGSVFAQDYPNIDCLVVDNGSTDDSVDTVTALIRDRPRCRLIELEANLGQLGAFFRVLPEIEGEFVVLLDADDMLAGTSVSSHVQVHLALAKPVAFTSANVIEIDAEGRAVTGGFQSFGSPVPWNAPGLVAPDQAIRIPEISDHAFDRLSTRSSAIPFWHVGWFWSPGSANMYRRSALRLVGQTREPALYMRAADSYLNTFCHALSGSALIDVPLSFYRIHDRNYFALRETLAGTHSGRPGFEDIHTALAGEMVAFFFEAADRFRPMLGGRRFWNLPEQIALTLAGTSPYRTSAFLEVATRRLGHLHRALGEAELLAELPLRLNPADAGALLTAALEEDLPADFAESLYTRIRQRPAAMRSPQDGIHHRFPVDGYPYIPRDFGPVAVVTAEPPVIKTGIAYDEWIGIAGAFGRRFGNAPAAFLIYPTWSIEQAEKIAAIAKAAREHLRRFPDHRLVYMTNTQLEADLLLGQGIQATVLNKNFTVSDKIFQPIAVVVPDFDAVYNARFVPEKRHELAGLVESCAYLGYLDGNEGQKQDQLDRLRRLMQAHPSHRLLNPLEGGQPRRLGQNATNQALNRARIGLCLSEVEGSNYASMEYMLAGLAVVSTPSKGGRDYYFDEEFCLVCEPDPKAVKRAVAELKARDVPRDYIRERTLARITKERGRFLALVDSLHRRLGGPGVATGGWPFGDLSGMVRWDTFDAHLERLEQASAIAEASALLKLDALGLASELAEIQLRPAEIAPIARAILARPRCRLLVFGCGNDSPFWERVNAGGITVFLEHDPDWIAKARAGLTQAEVIEVAYGTRAADWPAMIDAGDRLVLDLPDRIRAERWDVILVDGPPGWEDGLPGRSRSIVTAARLVAPGGKVFVHDCERPLEREFAARYLGESRRFTSVTGRALLNGYAF